NLVKRCISVSTEGKDPIVVLDYFGGSGTTAHAAIELTKKDGMPRKYILVEMGRHFETVVKPRTKKVIYASKWASGKPEVEKREENQRGHIFKYVCLESYEDVLGNLSINRAPGQQQLLNEPDESDKSDARQAYIMNYML